MTRKRLGELLVEAGLLSGVQLDSALAHQQQWGGRIGRIVVQMGFTPEPRMLRILAAHLGVPLADPPADDLHPRVVDEIPADLATRWMVFPLAMRRDVSGEALVVAMSDPTSAEGVEALRQHTGKAIYVTLAGDSQIEAWIRRHYFREGRHPRPPSDTDIPLVTGAIVTPAPQPGLAAMNPFASAAMEPLMVDDPISALDLKPIEVPGSQTSAGMVGIAELQPISANVDVLDLEPLGNASWSPPAVPEFDTSGGYLSSDDEDVGALPPPSPFATPSFAAPPVAAPVAPSFAGPAPSPPPPPMPSAPPPSMSMAPPQPAAAIVDPFGLVSSTIAMIDMPAPGPPPVTAPALAVSWADQLAPVPPTPMPELPPPTPRASAGPSSCPRCAAPRVESARFCPFCGQSFVVSPPAASGPAPSMAPPGMATDFPAVPVSAEAMPTPIATGVLILDDDVVDAAMARRGTPMPMPSLAVIHALDAIAAEGPPPPSPFDALGAPNPFGAIGGPAPGDAPTDALPVGLPDTNPLGETVEESVAAPVAAPEPDPSLQTLELSILEELPGEAATEPPVEVDEPVLAAAATVVDPVTATSVGLALIAIEPPDADAIPLAPVPPPPLDPVTATSVGLALVAIEPPGEGDAAAAAPALAAPPLDPVTATSVGLDLIAIEVPGPAEFPPLRGGNTPDIHRPKADELDPVSATSVGLSLIAIDPAVADLADHGTIDPAADAPALDAVIAGGFDVDVDVGADVDLGGDPPGHDVVADVADDAGLAAVDDSAIPVPGEGALEAAALASQWADAAERPIPRQETDTRNAPGWIPPSREILVVPEEVGPAPEPVKEYAPAAAPRAAKPAAPWARFTPKASPTPQPEADVAPTIELPRSPKTEDNANEPAVAVASVADVADTASSADVADVSDTADVADVADMADVADVADIADVADVADFSDAADVADVANTADPADQAEFPDVAATLEMARPIEASADLALDDAEPAPVSIARIAPSIPGPHADDIDSEPAMATEQNARPVFVDHDDDVVDTVRLARPSKTVVETDVDAEALLPTVQTPSPAVGLRPGAPESAGAPADGWSLTEPARATPAPPRPGAWTETADVAMVRPTELDLSHVPAAPMAPTSPAPAPAEEGAEEEVVELAPWPGSPGAAEGPPPMKLTPTMVMRMDPAEQRRVLALLLEKHNAGPEGVVPPVDPDKSSS